jgi:opacity protein-like surface antigen
MTKKITIRTLLLAAVVAFGCAASSLAQNAGASAPAPAADAGKGLLGQSYVGLDYAYMVLHSSAVANYQGLNFEYNQPLNTGFDFNLGLGDSWSSQFSGTRARQKAVDANAIAFIPDLAWGRPFIGVGAGWIWTKTSNVRDNSFLYKLDTGVEFQVTRELSLTPVVSFTDPTALHVNNKWGYGVKANYWITSEWGVTAGVMRDNMVNTTFSVGTTFRF